MRAARKIVHSLLHITADWLMPTIRDINQRILGLAKVEFAKPCQRLLKIAAHVIETNSWVRVAFVAACPDP